MGGRGRRKGNKDKKEKKKEYHYGFTYIWDSIEYVHMRHFTPEILVQPHHVLVFNLLIV